MVYWRVTFRAVQGILLDAGSIRRELVVNKNSLAQPPQVALSVKTAPTQQSAILAGLQEETHLLKIIASDIKISISPWRSPTSLHVRLHRRPPVFAERRATRPNGSGGIVLAAMCWATSAQRRCRPRESLYLPTFSYLLDCQ